MVSNGLIDPELIVCRLADHILSLQAGASQEDDQHEAQMIAMVDKWLARVGAHKPPAGASKRPEDARVIVRVSSPVWWLVRLLTLSQVLTGASGSLGAHILHQLVSSSSVRKVICLSRAKSHEESMQRIAESMKARKLPVPGDKLVSYAANANAPLLGLTESEYNLIRDEVTDVIHVSFVSLSLPSNYLLTTLLERLARELCAEPRELRRAYRRGGEPH